MAVTVTKYWVPSCNPEVIVVLVPKIPTNDAFSGPVPGTSYNLTVYLAAPETALQETEMDLSESGVADTVKLDGGNSLAVNTEKLC